MEFVDGALCVCVCVFSFVLAVKQLPHYKGFSQYSCVCKRDF